MKHNIRPLKDRKMCTKVTLQYNVQNDSNVDHELIDTFQSLHYLNVWLEEIEM